MSSARPRETPRVCGPPTDSGSDSESVICGPLTNLAGRDEAERDLLPRPTPSQLRLRLACAVCTMWVWRMNNCVGVGLTPRDQCAGLKPSVNESAERRGGSAPTYATPFCPAVASKLGTWASARIHIRRESETRRVRMGTLEYISQDIRNGRL
jgi:hypothetical protein